MTFKKRRIRHNLRKVQKQQIQQQQQETINTEEIPEAKRSNNNHHHKVAYLTVAAAIGVILVLIYIIFSLISNLNFSSLIFSFGKELKTDSKGHTNFLLIGKGGEGHDGANLTDTLILASLDEKDQSVKMLSLPRDIYVDDLETGPQRLNKVYDTYLLKYDSIVAREKLEATVTDLTGIPIHYAVIVDFNGFVEIIDALGGIEVNVETAIYDPYYPLDGTIRYQTFSLSAGQQTLDGKTALKYARSRKTTSDFDRAKRQQQILSAAKEKALNLNILNDSGKIKDLYTSLSDNFETSLTVPEILELAKIGKDINTDNITTTVLNDDFTSCGGFLYSPSRELFGGAAVLLPATGDFAIIHRFAENYFYTNMIEEQSPVQILNGTKTPGLAGKYLNVLSRECLNTVYYGNASTKEIEETTIYYNLRDNGEDAEPTVPAALEVVTSIIDGKVVEGIPQEYLQTERRIGSEIVIEFGADWTRVSEADPFDSLQYILAPTEEEDEDEEETAESAATDLATEE